MRQRPCAPPRGRECIRRARSRRPSPHAVSPLPAPEPARGAPLPVEHHPPGQTPPSRSNTTTQEVANDGDGGVRRDGSPLAVGRERGLGWTGRRGPTAGPKSVTVSKKPPSNAAWLWRTRVPVDRGYGTPGRHLRGHVLDHRGCEACHGPENHHQLARVVDQLRLTSHNHHQLARSRSATADSRSRDIPSGNGRARNPKSVGDDPVLGGLARDLRRRQPSRRRHG